MQFERTTNYTLLNRLLRESGLYPFISDDFSPPVEEASVIEHPAAWYVLARDGERVLGFYMLAPDNGSAVAWILHTVMPLDARALTAMRELLGEDGWIWRNAPCLRVVTCVAGSNRIAKRFGLRAGLQIYGEDPGSILKNGKLEARILMGISKKEN